MVMEDPHTTEMADYYGIDIFQPGTDYEEVINANVVSQAAIYTLVGYLIMFFALVIITIPLFASGLIRIVPIGPFTYTIEYAPWVFLTITAISESMLALAPIIYIKRRGLSFQAIGLKKRINFSKETVFGLAFGIPMTVLNFCLVWLITQVTGPLEGIDPFSTSNMYEMIAWVIVMFTIVALSEELLFRGFLQRRLDDYLKQKTKHNFLAALLITSFVFSILHLDMIGFATRFILGMILGWMAKRNNYSIVSPTVAHGLNNSLAVILSFLGY